MGKDINGNELGPYLYQRANGVFEVRIRMADGHKEYKGFVTLDEAKFWADEKIIERNQAKQLEETSCYDDLTVDEWFNVWTKDIKKSTVRDTSLILYKRNYKNHIRPILKTLKVSEVRTIHCQQVVNRLKEDGYKPSFIQNVKVIMTNMFEEAVDNDLIEKNPATKVKTPSKQKSKTKIMTVEQQKSFEDYVADTDNGNLYCFILQTGLRIGEAKGLQWDDIDFDNKFLEVKRNIVLNTEKKKDVVHDPKTIYGHRIIPLTPKAIEILEKQKKTEGENERVFKINDIYSSHNLDKELAGICKRNPELPQLSLHKLRHTFATRCIEAGVRPKTLQELLGHANISTTMDIYVSVEDGEKEKEMDKLSLFLTKNA